jgi:hypothetical protein
MADEMAGFQEVLVSGPVSYSILSYKDEYNDLIVHNFGDVHMRQTQCEDRSKKLHEVMDDTFKHYDITYPGEKIDVFFEYGAHLKKVDDGSRLIYIHELTNYYVDCYQQSSKIGSLFERTPLCDEKYPNVRFHLIDLRFIIKDIGFFMTTTFFNKFFEKQFEKVKNPLIKNKLDEIYKNSVLLSHPVLSPVIDLYLLSRLFRPYVKKAIVYSGSAHSLMYDDFFESLKKDVVPRSPYPSPYIFVKKIFYDEDDLQCIFVPLKNNSFLFDREFLLKYEIDLGVTKPSTVEIKDSLTRLIRLQPDHREFIKKYDKSFVFRKNSVCKSRQQKTCKSRRQKTRKSRQQKTRKSR